MPRCLACGAPIPEKRLRRAAAVGVSPAGCTKLHQLLYRKRVARLKAAGLEGAALEAELARMVRDFRPRRRRQPAQPAPSTALPTKRRRGTETPAPSTAARSKLRAAIADILAD